MKFNFTLLLLLSILLTNCTIHKKRYSRGYTIERNNTFRSYSTNNVKHKKAMVSETDEIVEIETLDIETTNQKLPITKDSLKPSADIIEKEEVKTNNHELYNHNISSIKKESSSKRKRITPTKPIHKIKEHISPSRDTEVNNTFGILALVILILAIITVLLSIFSIAPFTLSSLIILAGLACILFYILTLNSFKEIRTHKVRNKWVSIVNFSIISIVLVASMFGLLLVGLFSLFYIDTVIILSILGGILILSLLLFILLFSFIKSMRSRK